LREKNRLSQTANLDEAQYEWAAKVLGVSAVDVKQAVDKWVYQAPLKHLLACHYNGVTDFFTALRQRGIKIAAVSDYPPQEKLTALELSCDFSLYTADPSINNFKPDPKAFLAVMNHFGLNADQVLVIGDRQECEGLAAKSAGMPYLLLTDKKAESGYTFNNYYELIKKLTADA
jgi:HAD superfamily hydrolase (TIGR01509 family)